MKPTTADVLRRLKQAGPGGVHSFEFRNKEQGRVHIDAPTRVSELVKAGYAIDKHPESLHGRRGTRYILRPARPTHEHEMAAGAERPGTSKGFAPSGLASKGGERFTGPPSPQTSAPPEPSKRGGGSHSPAPAASLPGSVVLERKPTIKGHRYANQPPDGRPDWVLVLDYSDKARPDFRWERRGASQQEAA